MKLGDTTPNYHDLSAYEYRSSSLGKEQRKVIEMWLGELDEFGMLGVMVTKHSFESGLYGREMLM